MHNPPKRLIVGISGASGIVYGIHLLKALKDTDIETHLILSKAGHHTLMLETDTSLDALKALATKYYRFQDITASIASGSFQTMGMIVIPCSVSTLAHIVHGQTTNLLTRAADVTLKERRKLVLLVRETPLHVGHLRNMVQATEMGAIIAPPTPAFYHQPKTVDDIISQTVGRALDLFGIDVNLVKRWREDDNP